MDVVVALGKIREKGLTEEADILEAAIDEALCDEPIVRIAGGMTADQIAEKVVQRLKSEVRQPLPRGVPAVPWNVDSQGDARSVDDDLVLFHIDFQTTHAFRFGEASIPQTVAAIVAAMNAYYCAPQTPAESAAANSETGIPDTAGYPDVNGN